MSVGSPTAETWFSSQWRPDNEFETDLLTEDILVKERSQRGEVPGKCPRNQGFPSAARRTRPELTDLAPEQRATTTSVRAGRVSVYKGADSTAKT